MSTCARVEERPFSFGSPAVARRSGGGFGAAVWAGWLAALAGVGAAAGQSAEAPREGEAKAGPRIANLVNFIRGVEPREAVDLVEPVRRQIALAHEHHLPTTFLIQYDALINPAFTDLLKKELGPEDEVGAWLEVVQPQVEAAGLKWRGRFPWDWHTDVGFTIGYAPEERRRLMDVYVEKFKAVFGEGPRSVGCWVIDAPTLNYLADTHGVTAACLCKDQMGTDGYNLWGGYWSQAYYPSRRNAYMPAQTAGEQLRVPVFRMLGSDPIHQYDTGLGNERQGVISLEPVYPRAGGDPRWVRWFFDVNFGGPALAFSYAQAGQENSFGWPAMAKGLEDQYGLMEEKRKSGEIRVETLGASGRWFRETFDRTPATAVTALKDWSKDGRRSVWYESRFYRVNLAWEGNAWRIRDVHKFDEKYAERYLTERVTTNHCTYDALPVVDGFNWSRPGAEPAGLRLVARGAEGASARPEFGEPVVSEPGGEALQVTIPFTSGGEVRVLCEPSGISVRTEGAAPKGWVLELTWPEGKTTDLAGVQEREIKLKHAGFEYGVKVVEGKARREGERKVVFEPGDGGALRLGF